MKSVVLYGDSVSEIKAKIKDAISDDFKPKLAIIFSSVGHDLEELCSIVSNENADIFGMTTAGEIANDEVFESAITLMLLDINREDFKIFFKETDESNTYDIVTDGCNFASESFKNPGILVAAPGLATDGEEVVETIIKHLGQTIPLYGGLAGDDLKMQETFIFTNNKITNDGIIFLVINSNKIEIKGMATSGWEAVGVEKTITKAEGNIVYTIDDQPALDFYIKYYNLTNDFEEASDIVKKIGIKFPLQVIRENKHPVLRAPLMGNQDDKSLIFAGKVAQGAKVKFSIQPNFEIIDSTIEIIESLKPKIPDADALIMFSCKARHGVLGPMMEDEIIGVRKIWNAPLVGLFTYGEKIGNTETNISDFHNETCSLVILKEK